MLKARFTNLMSKYSKNDDLTERAWRDIETKYSAPKRYYHNQAHLLNMLYEFEYIKELLREPDAVLFSLYYHDIIYNPSRKDNEERSAEFLKSVLQDTSYTGIELSVQQIEASKTHKMSENSDINLFLDIDMAILGYKRDVYTEYSKHVRKEYSLYPDILYKMGRKKVLDAFLEQDKIFKSDFFFDKYEKQARENILGELSLL